VKKEDIRDCFHFNPKSHPDKHVEKKMFDMAKNFRRYDVKWGVVNPGNALCVGILTTKKLADLYRKKHASAYVVVPVVITPVYTQSK